MASIDTTQLLSNLQVSGLQTTAPAIYDVIRRIILGLDNVTNDVIGIQSTLQAGGALVAPNDVTGFGVTLGPQFVTFAYDSQGPGFSYELKVGSTWETASYVTSTIANTIPINPLLVGTYTYLIKAINVNGVYSVSAASVTFTITAPAQIVATLQVITNNILFFWNTPASIFNIAYYNLYKDNVLLGVVYGTFFTYFEVSAGTYQYEIQAVDIAGNYGPTGLSATVTVPDPTDYISEGILHDDTFAGTKTKCRVDLNGYLLAPINITKTYQDHFDDNSWATPAAQVAAGYPIYIQPNDGPGTYVSIFDFGSVFGNVIVQAIYSTLPVTGTVAVTFTIATSTDGVTYDTPQAGTSRFSSSARYAKITVTFTATGDKALTYLTLLSCELNAHLENDSGNIVANSGDAGGTTISFNKQFLNVNSITTIVKQTVLRVVVIDFDYTLVSPTSFKVLVFDSGGTRKTETVGWAARGIII